jgi:hypothetical protein
VFHRIFPGSPSAVEVFDRAPYRLMRFVDAQTLVQGKQHLGVPLDYGLNYLRQQLLASCVHPNPKNVLVLGLGVGALPTLCRLIHPNIELTIIELNPAVIEAARTCFAFESKPDCKIICADAYDWLDAHRNHSFDLIFNDCFDGLTSSVHMRSVSTLESLASHLSDSGMLITNLLAHQNIPASDWRVQHGLIEWLWHAEKKSNLSLVYSHLPLHNESLQSRVNRLDTLGALPFSLEAEFNRLITPI